LTFFFIFPFIQKWPLLKSLLFYFNESSITVLTLFINFCQASPPQPGAPAAPLRFPWAFWLPAPL